MDVLGNGSDPPPIREAGRAGLGNTNTRVFLSDASEFGIKVSSRTKKYLRYLGSSDSRSPPNPDLDLATPNGVGDPNPSSTVPSPSTDPALSKLLELCVRLGAPPKCSMDGETVSPPFRDPAPESPLPANNESGLA